MPFPVSDRVVFAQNPLKEVICQLRFPPILRIQTTPPDTYQESIRDRFPIYQESPEAVLAIPDAAPADLREILRSLSPMERRKNHVFAMADASFTITLSQDSISLKTTAYPRWEHFRNTLDAAFNPFIDQYHPAFCTRIGLRYVDVIRRSELNLVDVPWKDLLTPHIAGEFADDNVAESIVLASRETTIALRDMDGRVTVRHGLGPVGADPEPCYIIDADFYKDTQTPLDQTNDILTTFNRKAGNLFRWCIADQLRDALQPELVPA